MTLPQTLAAFKKRKNDFAKWLTAHGSEVLMTTNPYEVARFTTEGGTAVVYRDQADRITSWQGGADIAFKAFVGSLQWRGSPKGKRIPGKKSVLHRTLLQRDGNNCFYCAQDMGDDSTIEHLLSVTHGGNSHIANLTLACEPCNKEADHLPVVQKLEMAMKKRAST